VERGLDDPYYKRRWHMEETWEVERVVDVDVRDVWSDARQQAGPMLRCRVKWQGWKSECDTWEPLWELLGPEAQHMALKALRLALRRSQRATRRREQRERCRKERRARRQRKQQAAEAVRELWAVAVALAHGAKLELPVDSAAISACTTGVTIRLEGMTPMRAVVARNSQCPTVGFPGRSQDTLARYPHSRRVLGTFSRIHCDHLSVSRQKNDGRSSRAQLDALQTTAVPL
jgi:hypothetical protein